MKMEGCVVFKVETIDDLKRTGMEFLLDSYDFEDDISGLYDYDPEIYAEFEHVGTIEVPMMVVVHGRMFVEDMPVMLDSEGNMYIEDIELIYI